MEMLQRISDIYRRITHASMRAGREPDAVRLVAVSKTLGADAVYEAYDDGLREFGENRLQEAKGKAEELKGLNITWHMVGHLQSNKAKAAVELFHLIHSVDSLKLLRSIDRHAGEIGKVQRVLLQAKIADEESKSGAAESVINDMMDESSSLGHVKVEGLMTVPPYFDEPEMVRPYFRRLKDMAGRFGLKELSMGMTGDFEVAIEEGATMVRIGTAIFGERDYA